MAVKPDASAGFSTGAKLLIGFMLGFKFLGYDVFLSICLGAIASSVGGFIASWWYAKDDYKPAESTDSALEESSKSIEPIKLAPASHIGFGVRSARHTRHRRTRAERRFGWLFRRNKG